MSFLRFLKSNILYIIWFATYFTIAWFIFGANAKSFAIVSVIYSISMITALSPVGEILLRGMQGCRLPVTEQEKNYLLPLFEEVYENAKQENPSLNRGIKIYVMDEMYVNAFAVGRKTIAVTRGALSTFTRDELKGILAHELGHMTFGHTKALLLSCIGNILFTFIIFVLRLALNILQVISGVTAHFNVIGAIIAIPTFIVKLIFEMSIFVFINAGEMFLSINSRVNEFEADKFAYTIGFGKELTDSLYLLQKISMNAKMTLSQKMKSSHPHTASRIQNLERLENMAYQQ